MPPTPHVLVVDCATGETDHRPMTEDELAALDSAVEAGRELALTDLRARRNAALSASDWTQQPDAPLTDAKRKAWARYRQELRDLPAAVGDAHPSAVELPGAPG